MPAATFSPAGSAATRFSCRQFRGSQTAIGSGLSNPEDLAVDSAGDLFISDSGNNRIVKITPGVPVTVSPAPTSISWPTLRPRNSFGHPETFTATISPPAGSTPRCAGTVTFFVGTTPIGIAPSPGVSPR